MSNTALEPDGDNFMLRFTAKDGNAVSLSITSDDVLALMQSAPTFRQFIMAKRHPGSVYATDAVRMGATWDGLGENILLQVECLGRGSAIYEVAPDNARRLISVLEQILAERPLAQSNRQ